ncbi:MAG: twin transmembrane helix small protein [Alphaproteobacteria bacterium]|nr:twin transmembrane helix small protein [Alphaproteobacteria bacterium]TAD87489.1 MAG: twin transmembrane helix small protein [Alphaproteobacteria bacterium]
MSSSLPVVLVLLMLGVVAVLLFGIVHFVRRGEKGARLSNKLMQMRVLLQGLALVVFAIIMWLSGR